MKNDIHISFEYISSKDNVIADMMSRFNLNFWEFKLDRSVYDFIMKTFKVKPTMDVFASNLTSRMSPYCSWRQDRNAIARDAFLLEDWSHLPYLFPPTPLLAKVVREVELRKTMAILVAPKWKQKDWYPYLMRMTVRMIELPLAEECLTHMVYQEVKAHMNPLCAFLLDGSLPDQQCLNSPRMQNVL